MIYVGTKLYGYCSGYFGRDSYDDKIIIAFGEDWAVAREVDTGYAVFGTGDPNCLLEEYTKPEVGD